MIINVKKTKKQMLPWWRIYWLNLGIPAVPPIIIDLILSFELWGRCRLSYELQWNFSWNYYTDSVCSKACRKASFCFARAFRGLYTPSAEVSGILRVENNGNDKDPFLHFKCQQSSDCPILLVLGSHRKCTSAIIETQDIIYKKSIGVLFLWK